MAGIRVLRAPRLFECFYQLKSLEKIRKVLACVWQNAKWIILNPFKNVPARQ
jgi:hypothetical protein